MVNSNWKFKLGITLIGLSTLAFASLLIIPFIHVDNKIKITITTVLLITGEVTFWSGGLLLGKELFSKYKAYLNPIKWFKGKRK